MPNTPKHLVFLALVALVALLAYDVLRAKPQEVKQSEHKVEEIGRTTTTDTVKRPCPPCPPCAKAKPLPAPKAGAEMDWKALYVQSLEEIEDLKRQLARGEELVSRVKVEEPSKTETWAASESKPACNSRFLFATVGPLSNAYALDGNMALGDRFLIGAQIGRARDEWWAGARIGVGFQ